MLTLLLLRHAKAVPVASDGDYARRLADRGATEAERLGDHLRSLDIGPSNCLVSPAARTRETFDIVSRRLAMPPQVTYEPELYSATAGDLRDRLRGMQGDVRNLMIVGHNPAIQDLTIMLAREGDRTQIARLRNAYPPCGLAMLAFDTDRWSDAQAIGGVLRRFVTPSDLSPSE